MSPTTTSPRSEQLVHLDESGDPGFNVEQGSSEALVIAAIISDSHADAEATAAAIHDYRENVLRKPRGFAFHFTNLKSDWRTGFFQAVRTCPFSVRAIVMRKDAIYEDTFIRQNPTSFYRFAVKLLLTRTFGQIMDAKLFIDGDANHLYRKRLTTYLRRECVTKEGEQIIRQVKMVPKGEGNVLVQLADMTAGAIARRYKCATTSGPDYMSIIQHKIKAWEFGRPRG